MRISNPRYQLKMLTIAQAIVAALEPPQTKKPKSMNQQLFLNFCVPAADIFHREGQGMHIALGDLRDPSHRQIQQRQSVCVSVDTRL